MRARERMRERMRGRMRERMRGGQKIKEGKEWGSGVSERP